MYVDQTLQINVINHRNLRQLSQNKPKIEQAQPNELTIPDVVISLSPLGFIFGWIVFFIALRKIRTFLDNKMVFTIKGLDKVPCKNCKFYSNNHYLKCAVNPSIVLTEEAMNCSEYSPTKSKFPSKNLF
ncbi:hypothetical protein FNW02_27070 [Komarekiella sp. 'clone 1']|uniref:Uncharacterized protein n=1 Tax=Komarekiella delphini-convector SJRDD-AB1 TaxID=2593771 RepID=A0AA40T2C4_9NOST|nr:hypothetical protein [Komarekiella delphini-convector]MBD6619390.1 hypothetical protein [Komarekiella delphini-convector SJRDD-AB1]